VGVNMKYEILNNEKIRIAVSGKSGCGNTTVSSLLSEMLGIKLINYTFRQLAQEENCSLSDILEKAKADDSYDIKIDTRQVEMAMKDSCVLGSRLAIWMLKQANLKVYLFASEEIRAKRILNREGGDLQQQIDFTSMRDASDTARYKKLYNIDNNDYAFADLIIDTSLYNPQQICTLIIDELIKRGFITRTTNKEKEIKMKDLKGPAFFSETGVFAKNDTVSAKFGIIMHVPEDINLEELDNISGLIFSTCPADVKQKLCSNNMLGIDLDKKSMEDMFHTFQDKDTECSIIPKEDGSYKVKLISGSLSKSYSFKLNEFDRKVLGC
jgi:cytidylate kinase